jgi:FkbM family methyltransferase
VIARGGEGDEVQLRPLDDIVAEQNLDEIAYIKVDVEGNELNTIKGANRTLEQHAPALEVEINPQMLHVAGRDQD